MIPLGQYIKMDPNAEAPFVLVKMQGYSLTTLHEVCGRGGYQHCGWYITFNGNSKQRRQQRRKLIRDLNQ